MVDGLVDFLSEVVRVTEVIVNVRVLIVDLNRHSEVFDRVIRVLHLIIDVTKTCDSCHVILLKLESLVEEFDCLFAVACLEEKLAHGHERLRVVSINLQSNFELFCALLVLFKVKVKNAKLCNCSIVVGFSLKDLLVGRDAFFLVGGVLLDSVSETVLRLNIVCVDLDRMPVVLNRTWVLFQGKEKLREVDA